MLKELFLYNTTQCDPIFKKLGYLKEMIAIDSKYQRAKNAWQPHLKSSQAAILYAVNELPRQRKIIILGSGLLLDVPIDELSKKFTEVVLVDVIHLRKVHRAVSRYKNVRLIESDITNLSDKVIGYKAGSPLPLSEPVIPDYDKSTDLVISLNIVSQLPLMFKKWLSGKFRINDTKLDEWTNNIMQNHLQSLSSLNTSVLVIADIRHEYHQHGRFIDSDDFAVSLALPEADDHWQWLVSPQGEMAKGITMESQVGTWFNWQEKQFSWKDK